MFRYHFGVSSPVLPGVVPPLNLTAAYRSRWYARFGQGSSISPPKVMALHRRGSISHTGWSFDWNNPSMNYLYHRTFLSLVPYVHKKGIKGKYRKFPRLWKVWYNPVRRQGSSRWKGACAHERSDYHTGTPLGFTQGKRIKSGITGTTDKDFKICPCQL